MIRSWLLASVCVGIVGLVWFGLAVFMLADYGRIGLSVWPFLLVVVVCLLLVVLVGDLCALSCGRLLLLVFCLCTF